MGIKTGPLVRQLCGGCFSSAETQKASFPLRQIVQSFMVLQALMTYFLPIILVVERQLGYKRDSSVYFRVNEFFWTGVLIIS